MGFPSQACEGSTQASQAHTIYCGKNVIFLYLLGQNGKTTFLLTVYTIGNRKPNAISAKK
ncbi:hypothetical protein SLEP1_g26426 [Rubroshorea leprosula]|uniref:Uncharacterized protein n=1 Tax=Rubroshorea leprosula TaxID=152421 RepID=A0AAV5JXP0_9ROSI|nr:hypothetical protein SLEP1_g26426 [Rubroshorea leprosula]